METENITELKNFSFDENWLGKLIFCLEEINFSFRFSSTTLSTVFTSRRLGDDRIVGPLGVVVSPFRPTSRIKGRGPHHHVEAARRWCSVDCHASEPLRRAIFGTTSSIFDLWSRPWGVARLLGLLGVSPRPDPSEGVG